MICRRAAELIARSLDATLSFGERSGLGVHILFCGPCRRFRKQLQLMHAATGAAYSDDSTAGALGLSADAQIRIIAALLEEPNG